MSKHTPGPWKAEVNEKSASINILGQHGDPMRVRTSDNHGSIVIVECWSADDDQPFAPMLEEQIANASLIAAAPELLEALRSAERVLTDHGYTEWIGGSIANIRAAIAKAEGN